MVRQGGIGLLTANDIRNYTFSKSMGGYKASEVEDFRDQCADTVAALTVAKADLDKKLEVLADKLVEYRNEEDSIRTALLSAQRLGDTVVRESNHKAGLILEDAKIKAEKMEEIARRNIQAEERELERIRKEVSNFKARMLSIYREHLSLIDILPDVKDEKPAPDREAEIESPAEEAPEKPVAFEQVETPVMPDEEDTEVDVVMDLPLIQEEEPPQPTRQSSYSRFGELKFGDDYDLSKDDDDTVGFSKRRR